MAKNQEKVDWRTVITVAIAILSAVLGALNKDAIAEAASQLAGKGVVQ